MRIPIREQLGLLVLLSCLVCMAVISVAVWITNYRFVTGVSSSSLTLLASLYAQQLSSTLTVFASGVDAISTRILIQNALSRYHAGNNTAENWARSIMDLQVSLGGGGNTQYLLQARVVSKNATGLGGPFGLMNVTASGQAPIQLPFTHGNGTPVFLGDNDMGYPANLYPELEYFQTPYNGTFSLSHANFQGSEVTQSRPLFLGPWLLNESLSLASLTVPIINNTSSVDLLGFLTVVINCSPLYAVRDSTLGLGNTGSLLIVGPDTTDNRLPASFSPDQSDSAPEISQQPMRFFLPPPRNISRNDDRHEEAQYQSGQQTSNYSFPLSSFPAVFDALRTNQNNLNNAGNLLDSYNERGDHISAGFALPLSGLMDLVMVAEELYDEVVQPITNLRNLLLACIFGTLGFVLLCLLPLAHYSVTPIRRLREATRKSIDPYESSQASEPADRDSVRSFASGERQDRAPADRDADMTDELARKEGLRTRVSRFGGPLAALRWRKTGRNDEEEVHGDSDGEEHFADGRRRKKPFRIPGKVEDRKHFIMDELTDLTQTYNEMTEELVLQYATLEKRVAERTRELELSKKAAEVANESKTLFIANISHELKTPLNGILGMTAVCMHEEDPAKIKRSLGIIYKSGDLLLNLLTDLLTFSRNQIGQQLTLDEKEFRLADISSQVLSIFEKQAHDASIRLGVFFEGPNESLETASGTPGQPGYGPFGTGRVRDMRLFGDQHRILQVVINLVSNSLKFTPPDGSVTVRIRCIGEASSDFEHMHWNNSRKSSTNSRHSKRSAAVNNNVKSSHARSPARKSATPVHPHGQMKRESSGSQASIVSSTHAVETLRLRPQRSEASVSALDLSPRVQPHPNVNASSPDSLPAGSRTALADGPPINARTLLFEFEVEDTGPGIPADQQQKVFEPFVQGDLGLSKKYGGTGLGLSICAQLANLMRGDITLKSEAGHGSVFTMRIPLSFVKEQAESTFSSIRLLNSDRASIADTVSADEKNAAAALVNHAAAHSHTGTPRRMGSDSELSSSAAARPSKSAVVTNLDTSSVPKPRLVGLRQPFFATSPPALDDSPHITDPEKALDAVERAAAHADRTGTKVRVLVAEDNKVNQEVVLRMLKLEYIYDVTLAKDGQEAFEMVKESMEQERLFNLIFMDIQMPNLDGLQSTRLIRGMGYSAPIVALTAFAEESNVQECMESGMDFFLPKPIRRPALKQVLKRYCATIPEEKEDREGEDGPYGEEAGGTNSARRQSEKSTKMARTEGKNETNTQAPHVNGTGASLPTKAQSALVTAMTKTTATTTAEQERALEKVPE